MREGNCVSRKNREVLAGSDRGFAPSGMVRSTNTVFLRRQALRPRTTASAWRARLSRQASSLSVRRRRRPVRMKCANGTPGMRGPSSGRAGGKRPSQSIRACIVRSVKVRVWAVGETLRNAALISCGVGAGRFANLASGAARKRTPRLDAKISLPSASTASRGRIRGLSVVMFAPACGP